MSETICCRPPRSDWALAVLPGFYGLISALAVFAPAPAAKSSSPLADPFFVGAFVVCCFSLLAIIWRMLWTCIVADADGLRMRRFGGWKRVKWHEISDFYQAVPAQAQSTSGKVPCTDCFVVEALLQKFKFSCLWSNAQALRKSVAQNAVHSRAADWEVKGTRVFDLWPRTFDYDTRENRWAPRIWLKLFVVFVVYLLIQPALQLGAIASLVGWAATLVMAGAYVLLVGSLGLIFLLPLAQYRAANGRKDEHITVGLDGIAFENKTRRVEAAWADVTGYQKAYGQGLGSRFVVETRHGEFDFLSSLGETALLQAIIQRFAREAADKEWCSRVSPEILGGEAARWTGGKVGVGKRFFHYRTRTYRALLFGITALSVVCFLLIACSALGWLPGASPPVAAFAGCLVWSVLLLLGARAYQWNGVAMDENGLTQRTVFGSRSLAWEQVQEFKFSAADGGKAIGRTQTVRFGHEIVGCEELTQEIKGRTGRTRLESLSS